MAANRIQHILQEKEDLENLINVLGKPILEETKAAEKPTETQFNELSWTLKKGTKSDYEQTENNGSQEFKAIAEYVKANKGFVHFCGYKVFFHYKDENLIDRKLLNFLQPYHYLSKG